MCKFRIANAKIPKSAGVMVSGCTIRRQRTSSHPVFKLMSPECPLVLLSWQHLFENCGH